MTGDGPFLRALQQAGNGAVGLERHSAGQQFVKDQPDGEDVRAGVQFFRPRLLWRHVLDRAQHGAGLGHAVGLQRSRQAEVHHRHASLAVAHDVAGLQVAVDDALAVRRLQSGAHLLDDFHGLVRRKLAPLRQQGAQVRAHQVLHGDELDAVGFADVENANDVAVGDLASGQQLLLEPRQDLGIARQVGPDHLQRDGAIEFAVLRLVNRAHAAQPQHLQDLVAAAQHCSRIQDGVEVQVDVGNC